VHLAQLLLTRSDPLTNSSIQQTARGIQIFLLSHLIFYFSTLQIFSFFIFLFSNFKSLPFSFSPISNPSQFHFKFPQNQKTFLLNQIFKSLITPKPHSPLFTLKMDFTTNLNDLPPNKKIRLIHQQQQSSLLPTKKRKES
jgi:hypothetical protein